MSGRRKRVYLFELDSVRTSDKEIIEGQKALYHEIVTNGNIVVMTFNQLVDSRAFFSLLSDPEYYENLIRLFEMGAIKISQFGETRTLAQYLINSVEQEKEFIYSGWPLRYEQRRLLVLIKRSLVYSDLTEISGFIGGSRGEDEIRDLFVELRKVKNKDGKVELKEAESDLSLGEMMVILRQLYWLLKMVLRLSPINTIYTSPWNSREYHNLRLTNIIEFACNLKNDCRYWEGAIRIIQSLPSYKRENPSQDRSVYHHEILQAYQRSAGSEEIPCKETYQYAEAIVDICYLYTCEISIMNTSKHYNVEELTDGKGRYPTFQEDFLSRLAQTWDEGDLDQRFLVRDTNDFDIFTRIDKIPDMGKAVRYLGYLYERETKAKKKEKKTRAISADQGLQDRTIAARQTTSGETVGQISSIGEGEFSTGKADNKIYRYEYKFFNQRLEQEKAFLKTLRWKILGAVICVVIACLIELFLQWVQQHFGGSTQEAQNSNIIGVIIQTIVFLALSEFATYIFSLIASRINPDLSMSLSTAMGSICRFVSDLWSISSDNTMTYCNSQREDCDKAEKYNDEKPIHYLTTPALKKYKAFKNEVNKSLEDYESAKKREHSGTAKKPGDPEPIKKYDNLFADSETYPFADLDKALPELLRDEELYGRQYGIVYRSKFNIFCVDPIEGKKHNYFPYERVIPTAGNGDILVCIHDDKFVLLKQYRHAPRKIQYAFPRGFAEPGLTPEKNAVKELGEELHAELEQGENLIYLGGISPDSGLASTCANVYLVYLKSYGYKEGDEGIKSTVELSSKEFEDWIDHKNSDIAKESNETRSFDDGYTFAAWRLYEAYKRRNGTAGVQLTISSPI